jgi:hypothetical protein
MDKATKLIKETYFLIRFYLTISDKTVEIFLKKILLMIIFIFLMGQYSVFGQITSFNVALPNPCTNQLNTSEVSIPNHIIIYPNPTRGIMNIQLIGVNTTEEIEIKIFDSYGNLGRISYARNFCEFREIRGRTLRSLTICVHL